MFHKPVELLAPAGSMDAYKAASAAGADAVYLGAKGFNARQHAQNFELGELKEVIEDARVRGIKLYFVLNTLVGESEIQKAVEFASFVYSEGIDGIIVQDLGLARIIRQMASDLPIHASTQMTIHNTDGVKAVQEMGIKRVVLSRELDLDEIKLITGNTGIEAEVFIHGALCISRSGQCLLSSFIGGRSGNRGRCAQPCRLPWKMEGVNTAGNYLLSSKDLMALELLPELLEAGVSALKIEGRMKSPEYVAGVVSIYRKYLDLAIRNPDSFSVESEDIRTLLQIFNRGGFSTGYLKQQSFKNLLSTEHPKNWGVKAGTVLPHEQEEPPANRFGGDGRLIRMRFNEKVRMGDGLEIWDSQNNYPSAIISVMMKDGRHVKTAEPHDILLVGNFKTDAAADSPVYKTYEKELMESLYGYTRKNVQSVPITGTFRLFAGEKPVLVVSDTDENTACEKGENESQKALVKPLLPERIREQLEKTKDTPYFFESISVRTDSMSYIPISNINIMRRNALLELSKKRLNSVKRTKPTISPIKREHFPGNEVNLSEQRGISLYFYTVPKDFVWEDLIADRVYLPVTALDHTDMLKKREIKRYVWTPAVLHDRQLDLFIKKIEPFVNRLEGVLVGNIGILYRVRKEFPELITALDFTMNVFNSWAIDELRAYKPSSVMLSLELDMEAVMGVKSFGIPLEAYVYGEIPVMTLEYCPGSNRPGCIGKCESCGLRQGFIQDRTGRRFSYVTDPMWKRTTLFNSSRLMLEDVSPFAGTDVRMLRIGIMNESPEEINSLCRFYYNHWNSGDKREFPDADNLNTLKAGQLTRGHYYRSVE